MAAACGEASCGAAQAGAGPGKDHAAFDVIQIIDADHAREGPAGDRFRHWVGWQCQDQGAGAECDRGAVDDCCDFVRLEHAPCRAADVLDAGVEPSRGAGGEQGYGRAAP